MKSLILRWYQGSMKALALRLYYGAVIKALLRLSRSMRAKLKAALEAEAAPQVVYE